ncbi:MAG TPA: hypothetical protein VMT73_03065, partial [Anaerolineales bacterium]|nr:hypothetical protein [Anaerolineales bacterium]
PGGQVMGTCILSDKKRRQIPDSVWTALNVFSIAFYNHGILTFFVYSVQALPNIFDNFFSSSGA